jgi:hypothetical protein
MIEVTGLAPDVFSALNTYVFLTKCVKEVNSLCSKGKQYQQQREFV